MTCGRCGCGLVLEPPDGTPWCMNCGQARIGATGTPRSVLAWIETVLLRADKNVRLWIPDC